MSPIPGDEPRPMSAGDERPVQRPGKKTVAQLSIQEFHKLVQTEEQEDELPRGPSEGSAGVSCKWVEWDGRTGVELTEPDPGPASAAINDVASFKDAVDACLTEFLLGFDMLEAARCIREMQASLFLDPSSLASRGEAPAATPSLLTGTTVPLPDHQARHPEGNG